MGFFKISDGGGRGRLATVSSFLRLNVSAKTNPRTFYASRDEGLTFDAVSDVASAAAADVIFYLKNTSTDKNAFVKHIEFHSDNDAVYKVYEVTGTAAGTALLPSNLNLGSKNAAEALFFGDAAVTGLTLGKVLGTHRSQAGGDGEMEYNDALILSPNTSIAIVYETGTTGRAEIDCFFHYEGINEK